MQDLYKHAFDTDAELVFLGCFSCNQINPFPTLIASDFYNSSFSRLYTAFLAGDFDPTMTNFARYDVDRELWLSVMESTGSDAQGSYHGAKVSRLSAIRKGIKQRLDEIQKLSNHVAEDVEQINDLVGATGATIALKDYKMMGDGALQAFEESKDGFLLPDGLQCLHNMTRAFSVGEQLVIGAASGAGKTALGMRLCENYKTLFISAEMPELSLDRRYHGMEYWKRADSQDDGFFANEEDQEADFRLAQTDGRVYTYFNKNWRYITRPLTIAEIRKAVAIGVRDFGCEVFLIDYLQLMRCNGQNRRTDIADLARGTKQIAVEFSVRSILLSQVSRPEKSISASPRDPATVQMTLDRLKESGDIEESADIVLGMWLHQSRDTCIQVVQDIKNRQLGVHSPKNLKRIGPYLRTAKDVEVHAFDDQFDAKPQPKKRFTYGDN